MATEYSSVAILVHYVWTTHGEYLVLPCLVSFSSVTSQVFSSGNEWHSHAAILQYSTNNYTVQRHSINIYEAYFEVIIHYVYIIIFGKRHVIQPHLDTQVQSRSLMQLL